MALLIAAALFQGVTALSTPQQITATPTPDRLAQPTLPAIPSQSDVGAQVYWLECLACHGDKGQGLTAEFRETYPPEEQYCWQRGCHGKNPYDDGFTLPPIVPRLIGPGALQKFPTAANLQGYVSTAMPFWRPGRLSAQQSWAVTAFLLRENGLLVHDGDLDGSNAGAVFIAPAQATPTATPETPEASSAFTWIDVARTVGGIALVAFAFFLALRGARERKTARRP
jgi:mono/diheme cytochrome c family protein